MSSTSGGGMRSWRWSANNRAFEMLRVPIPLAHDSVVVVTPIVSGVCGSDTGAITAHDGSEIPIGWPSHEVLGVVADASSGSGFEVGQVVIGWAKEFCGLAELVECELHEIASFTPSARITIEEHIIIQPLACVEHALMRLPPELGRVGILGGGAMGMLFARRLATQGVQSTVFDKVRRRYAANDPLISFKLIDGDLRPIDPLGAHERFDTVFECIGHNPSSVAAAADLVDEQGCLYLFGVPTPETSLSINALFNRNASVLMGVTYNQRKSLNQAIATLEAHPNLAKGFLTDRFTIEDIDAAYRRSDAEDPERCKVAIIWPEAPTSY